MQEYHSYRPEEREREKGRRITAAALYTGFQF
jgi:hypothetical protein